MSEIMWVRSHVERLLQDTWSTDRVIVDEDGDYPFQAGPAAAWVRVLDSDPVMVRVVAIATYEVKPSLKLLRELNDIEGRTLTVSIRLEGDAVVVRQTISPIGLTQPVLAQALSSVVGVANDVGVLLASMFGGRTPYTPELMQSEDVA